MRTRKFLFGITVVIFAFGAAMPAQTPTPSPKPRECDVPAPKEIDRRPRILAKPDPKFTKREREKYRYEEITLSATLCGSGKVTDITVTSGLTAGMDAAAVDAARLIQFTPAEKDGQKVSRHVILKYFVR
jgi:TonB family protein